MKPKRIQSNKTNQQQAGADEFWTHRQQLFTGTFRYYHHMPKPLYGRFHLSEERYFEKHEIIPLTHAPGTQTYVSFQPYGLVPNMTLTVGLYRKPKEFADMEPAIGKVISSRAEQEREEQIGSGQAWYYHEDRLLVLWECFFWDFVRDEQLPTDQNMRSLWRSVEEWLRSQFPQAEQVATPWSDPAFSTPAYQQFLRDLGYRKVRGHAVFGKPGPSRRAAGRK
jgi:hypothetical protein